jgi:hypothetical protein
MANLPRSFAAAVIVCSLLAAPSLALAQASDRAAAIALDADDIGGVVTSDRGPEAGVWVIAETTELPTKFRKIVVSDDEGRYVLPDLPRATYTLWVRGYGLVDSPSIRAMPGARVPLRAVIAPDARAAAQIYPANYWYSLIQIPQVSEFPGTGAQGNGIEPRMLSQHYWINEIKTGCNVCHQLGNLATRQMLPALGKFESSFDAWDHRTQVGQDGTSMIAAMGTLGRKAALTMYADWTDRIAAGELPPVPPRPEGIERNLVLTEWEWGAAATFAHDELSTDKRNPTANARGPIYGVDWGNDAFLTLDPNTNKVTDVRIPVRDPNVPPGKPQSMPKPSPYWGNEPYWFDPAITNHAAMDRKGRVWMSSRFRRPEDQPEFCKNHPSAALAPRATSFRQVQYYDPRTKQFHQVNTCFDTHHVQFANDKDETLYANGVFSGALGWINTRVLEETGNEAAAQGWCLPYYDIDGDGKIDPKIDRYVFSNFPRPTGMLAGMEVPPGVFYSVIAHPTDGSIWGAVPGPMPGRIVRIDPKTCVSEVYEPPFNNPAVNVNGYTPRGIDVDSNGVIWTALAGSGHLASFDRRKCRVMKGPEATNPQHCAEGWTLYRTPGPHFKGATDAIPVDMSYYNFVDQHNTLGLGPNVAIANGTNSDSLLALRSDGSWVRLRVPYPLGFFSRGMDGRIDDPNGGWKGRALYADYGENAVWHIEGGKGTRSSVVKFQLRPDPLAK